MLKSSQVCAVPFIFAICLAVSAHAQSSARSGSNSDAVMKPTEITEANLFPDRVFYRAKTAPTQLRNTGGVHFADGYYFLAGLVDTAGYSTAIQEKYQAYLLTEVSLDFAGHELKAGAYGGGFIGGNFVVTDLGAHDVFQIPAKRDTEMKRPIPLQVSAGSEAGVYRLYHGRDFVEFRRPR